MTMNALGGFHGAAVRGIAAVATLILVAGRAPAQAPSSNAAEIQELRSELQRIEARLDALRARRTQNRPLPPRRLRRRQHALRPSLPRLRRPRNPAQAARRLSSRRKTKAWTRWTRAWAEKSSRSPS